MKQQSKTDVSNSNQKLELIKDNFKLFCYHCGSEDYWKSGLFRLFKC